MSTSAKAFLCCPLFDVISQLVIRWLKQLLKDSPFCEVGINANEHCQHTRTKLRPLFVTKHIYRVSQEERNKLRGSVPYVKIYRYNPKHLYPKLNGYRDNGQRSLKL